MSMPKDIATPGSVILHFPLEGRDESFIPGNEDRKDIKVTAFSRPALGGDKSAPLLLNRDDDLDDGDKFWKWKHFWTLAPAFLCVFVGERADGLGLG